MNFCYIFTIFCAIFLLAVIFVNQIEAYVARRHKGKAVQQLNEFRQEALKTKEDLEKLANMIRENQEHGKRKRRQTTSNILNNFPQNIDNEKFDLDAINPNPLTDFSKEVSFGGVCMPDSLKHSLQSSKEFNGFLSNLKLEHTQMPRDLNLWEREQKNGDENEETNESRNNEENSVGRNGAKFSGFSRKFRPKEHLYKNSNNHAQNTEMLKSFLRENSGINSHQTFSCLNSDLSSCQHCSEHEQVKNMNNNAMKNKYWSRVSDYQINKDRLPEAHDKNSKNFPKTSKHLKKLQSFGRKYPTENQKDEDDDEDEEEDSLYQLRNPSVISNDNKHETENRNSSPYNNHNYTNFPNMENKTNSLNDQLENTKNNLSHEANYKLSKVEQDNSEKQKDFSWKWGIFKRSYQFNPMNEIKLKTSSRLMKKGFGASLPSYSLGETRKELLIENKLRRKEMEMLQQKNQKYEVGNLKSFKEPFGSHIRENNKHLEDFEASPMEPDLRELPQNNWNYNRRKRISDSLARYKREQQVNSANEMIGLIDSKAFNKSSGKVNKSFKSLKDKEIVNHSLRSEPNEVQTYINKPNDKPEDSIKPINPKDNIDGDISNQIEASKRLDNSKKALKLRDTVADDEDINNQIEESELKNTSANFAVQNEPHFLVDSIKETYKIPNFQDFPEILDTINTNLQNLKDKVDQETNFKTVRRRKRSILMKTFTKDLDAVKTANISQNKSQTKPGNFSIRLKQSLVIPLKKTPITLKILKRVKRLKPSNILQFKIYQKFHTPPALRYKYYKLNGQSFKKLLKYDKRTRNKRSLQSKFIALNSSTEKHNFITKLTKKLYRKARNLKKHFKAFVKKSLQYLTLQETYNRILKKSKNSLNENYKAIPIENIESEALNVSEPNKKADVINLNKQMINESFTVDALTITYKININPKLKFLSEKLYNLFGYNQSFKRLNDKEHTVYYKDRSQRFVKHIKQIDNGTENSSRYSKANNNATEKATTSNFNQEDSIKVRNMFENNLNQTLSSNESFVSRKRQKRAIASHYKRTLKHLKLNRNDFLKRSQIFAKTLKRSKRSLNSKQSETSLESDTTKHFNDKRYFSQFDDLYKPQHTMDYLDRKQSKLNQGNDFDFQRSLKSFDTDQFNNFKQKDNTNFDNLWFKDKSSNDNFNEHKRFLNPKKTNQRNTPNKYFKRHNFNILQKNLTSNKTNVKNLKSRDFPLKVQMIKDKYLSDLKDFNQNYKFNENHFNWPNPIQKSYIDIKDNSTTTDDSQKLGLELRNEILNCKAFASLEEFLKSLPKNITNSLLNGITEVPVNYQSTEQIEMAVNTPIIMEVTTNSGHTVLDSTINCSTTTEANTFEETETNTECTEDVYQQSDLDSEQSTESRSEVNNESSTESSMEAVTTECLPSNPMAEDEDVKLNITINANVHGNPKTHQFCGNGSFNFIPGLEDERRRREIFYSSLENFQKRKCAQIPTQKPYDAEDNEDFSDLMSGKLSSNLVKTILNTVRESPNLKVLWPSLQHNQAIENTAAPNFYAIRNQQNENQLQNHEKLLAQIMSSINNIIEQQARSHACVPLRPDLQEFYNIILQSRREQDMIPTKSKKKRK
ncbi:MATH and LRR domain-containing protein PFE0570w isoform X2 [Calliphora vicina]|uniref:MATH and LRR domain-containing protein PFE0570w isoform X2 n=1 Tax=Calliphora vicina TaxID=7373 RepID=UPI00325A91DF